MFKMFDRPTVKEENTNQHLEFNLSDDVQIFIELNETPFFSRCFLSVNKTIVADLSIDPDKAEAIECYAKENKYNNNALLAKLEELGLTKFVEKIKKYQDTGAISCVEPG
jgi:hypothetical protein